jgi:hypothetical protein
VAEVVGGEGGRLVFGKHAFGSLLKLVAVVVLAEDEAPLRYDGVERRTCGVAQRKLATKARLIDVVLDGERRRTLSVMLGNAELIERAGS